MAAQWQGFVVDGFFFPEHRFDVNAFKERRIDNWDIRNDDVVIATFMKSGTLWMHAILKQMCGDLNWQLPRTERAVRLDQFYENTDEGDDFYTVHKRAVQTTLNEMPSPRLLTTHLPPQLFNTMWTGGQKKCKIICVTRNPKDVCVSSYHFLKGIPRLGMALSWDEWVEAFATGRNPSGPWLDFVMAWQQYGLADGVLHLSFEDMKTDLKQVLVKLSEFMDRPKSDEELDRIVTSCSFNAMKDTKNNVMAIMTDKSLRQGGLYYRKGKVGDWKNHFTVAQNELFDRKITREAEKRGLKMVYEL
ncbi:sulfotransferase 1E1-like [Glandiceps talaboti]